MARTHIGFIGLGAMGGNMARRLAGLGFTVAGYDPSDTNAKRSGDAGVKIVDTPAAAADGADFVLSSVPDPAAIRQSYLGPDGVMTRVRSGMILIDLSTIDPATWREVAAAAAKHGVACLDAPVSGGPADAGSGKLVFLIGGEASVIEKSRAVLDALGNTFHHVGPLGSGLIVKLVNNVISAGVRAVTFEALAMGIKNGLSLETCTAVLQKGSARSATTELALPKLLKGDFSVSFTLALMHKDVRLATKLGNDSATPMMLANIVRELFQTVINEHGADKDTQTLVKLFERNAGVAIAPRN